MSCWSERASDEDVKKIRTHCMQVSVAKAKARGSEADSTGCHSQTEAFFVLVRAKGRSVVSWGDGQTPCSCSLLSELLQTPWKQIQWRPRPLSKAQWVMSYTKCGCPPRRGRVGLRCLSLPHGTLCTSSWAGARRASRHRSRQSIASKQTRTYNWLQVYRYLLHLSFKKHAHSFYFLLYLYHHVRTKSFEQREVNYVMGKTIKKILLAHLCYNEDISNWTHESGFLFVYNLHMYSVLIYNLCIWNVLWRARGAHCAFSSLLLHHSKVTPTPSCLCFRWIMGSPDREQVAEWRKEKDQHRVQIFLPCSGMATNATAWGLPLFASGNHMCTP